MTSAPDEIWRHATWAGNRQRQHREFQALSLREKVLALEEMQRVAEALRIRHGSHGQSSPHHP